MLSALGLMQGRKGKWSLLSSFPIPNFNSSSTQIANGRGENGSGKFLFEQCCCETVSALWHYQMFKPVGALETLLPSLRVPHLQLTCQE